MLKCISVQSRWSMIEGWSLDGATVPVVYTRLVGLVVKLRISISRSNKRLRHRSVCRDQAGRRPTGAALSVTE